MAAHSGLGDEAGRERKRERERCGERVGGFELEM